MNRKEIRDVVLENLNNFGFGYYTTEEVNDSIQDAYNEITAKSQSIVKSVNFNFIASNYYNFKAMAVAPDYLGTIAIQNNATNLFLFDNLTLRDFDRLRIDWECWHSQPIFWAPHSVDIVAIVPKLNPAIGSATLFYWATAPVLDTDNDVPLVATDMQTSFEHYCTADLLETAGEIVKAMGFWAQFENNMKEYKTRCHNQVRSDLSSRV